MATLAALLSLSLAASGPTYVLIEGEHVGVSPAYAGEVANQLVAALGREGFTGAVEGCTPAPACVSARVTELRRSVGVLVTLTRELSSVSVELVALKPQGAELLRRQLSAQKDKPQIEPLLAKWAGELAQALKPPPEPKVTTTTPPPGPTAAGRLTERPDPSSTKTGGAFKGASVAAFIVGATLLTAAAVGLVVGVTQQNAYYERCRPVPLDATCGSTSPPHPLRAAANVGLNLALFTGLGGALGVGLGFFFLAL